MSENELIKLTDSCWTIYLHPFTFIVPDNETPLVVSIDEINNISYKSRDLVRIVTSFAIPNCETVGFICYDGAISIPCVKPFESIESAERFFNSFIAKLLLNNFYVEGVDTRDIVTARLLDKWAIWYTYNGSSRVSHLHTNIRTRYAGINESIFLANPRVIKVGELKRILNEGESIFNRVPNLSPKFLTKGITEIFYKNWDLALSNLWIIAEQLIDHLWFSEFINNRKFHPIKKNSGRFSSFKEDNRTWSASVKQEILFQSRIINENIFLNLYNARKFRNKLIHEGKPVDKNIALSLFYAVKDLLKIVTKEKDIFEQINFPLHMEFEEINRGGIELFKEWIEASKKFE